MSLRRGIKIPLIGPIKGVKAERPIKLDLPRMPRGPRLLDPRPEHIRQWARLIGDQRAREIERLTKKGARGTLPELIALAWLQKRGKQIEVQTALMGGRVLIGGSIADFIIYDAAAGGVIVWRVQGTYWHGGRVARERDRAQKARILTARYKGLPVVAVVDLKEEDLYNRFPDVLLKAELGVEI